MTSLLALTDGLPEVELQPGGVLVHEGTRTGSIWVLVSGSLDVRKGGSEVNRIDRQGAAIGEVAVLLGTEHGATVTALEPCRLRYAADGGAFLAGEPEAMRIIAVGLAERLNIVTAYLADLKSQYADAPGIAMVSDVLARLSGGGTVPARSGSARDPDPEY